MSDRFTDSIEPLALATQGRTLEGKLPLAKLRRLQPLVCSDENEVEFELHFDIDEGGVPRVMGNVRASLVLQCQRCLKDMEYPVSTDIRLGIVKTRAAAEQLPDNVEPLVLSEEETSIVSILEDELILALPIVAMHEIERCPLGDDFSIDGLNNESYQQRAEKEVISDAKRENPFAVLAQLKVTKSKDTTGR